MNINPATKYIVAGTLGLAGMGIGLHYISHGWLALETRALNWVSSQESLLTSHILDKLLDSPTSPKDTESLQRLVSAKAKQAGLPPELVLALVDVESGWKPDAIRFEPRLMKGSSDSARMVASSHGLMQIMGSWAKTATCPELASWADLYDPTKNVTCGIRILAQAKKATGSTRKALVAYNGGTYCTTHSCPSAESHANKVLNNFADRIAQ